MDQVRQLKFESDFWAPTQPGYLATSLFYASQELGSYTESKSRTRTRGDQFVLEQKE